MFSFFIIFFLFSFLLYLILVLYFFSVFLYFLYLVLFTFTVYIEFISILFIYHSLWQCKCTFPIMPIIKLFKLNWNLIHINISRYYTQISRWLVLPREVQRRSSVHSASSILARVSMDTGISQKRSRKHGQGEQEEEEQEEAAGASQRSSQVGGDTLIPVTVIMIIIIG